MHKCTKMPTHKEKVWLEEYFRCGFNATEAARRAGYKWPHQVGTRIAKRFADAIKQRMAELTMSADEVLVRLSEIAGGEYGKYLHEDGTVDFGQMIRDGKGYLIHKVYDTREGKRVEFYNMQTALVDVGKAQKLFTTQVDVTSGGKSLVDGERDRLLADIEKKMEAAQPRPAEGVCPEPE